jgi:hypothetical protein
VGAAGIGCTVEYALRAAGVPVAFVDVNLRVWQQRAAA